MARACIPHPKDSASVPGLPSLQQLLNEMIEQDITVTFRKVAEQSGGRFPHASTLTRSPDRRAVVEAAVVRQAAARAVAKKFAKNSPSRLADRLAELEAENVCLRRQRDFLVASHRAAILAIGKIGGMKAWREYFPEYSEAISGLQDLGALPDAHVAEFPAAAKNVKK